MFKWRVHPALPPPFHQHTPTYVFTPTPRLALLSLLMCNKQRLCTIFTQNILCLVSCRCTQNSCCSSPQHPIVCSLNHISAPPKGRRLRLKATPPPTQTSSRQQCSVLHKKERGNMKTQTASQGIEQQGRRRPKIQINTDAHIQSKRHTHTSAIPLQESVLFYYYFLLLNPSVLMIHNAWQRGEGGLMNQFTRTQNTEHRHKRALTETGGDKHKHTHLKPTVTHNGRLV